MTLIDRITQRVQAVITAALTPIHDDVRGNHDSLVKGFDLFGSQARTDTEQILAAVAQQADIANGDSEKIMLALAMVNDKVTELQQAFELLVNGPPPTPCSVKDCTENAAAEVPVPGYPQPVPLCGPHAKIVAKQAFQQQAPAKPVSKVCEQGFDHSDDPEYVPGQIHAHVEVADNSPAAASAAITQAYEQNKDRIDAALDREARPDMSVLDPQPLDDISAQIEALYAAGGKKA